MNWNPFNRIAALERELAGLRLSHNRLIERFDILNSENAAHAKALAAYINKLNNLDITVGEQQDWLGSVVNRVQGMYENQLFARLGNPIPTISRADVEKEAKARLKRAAYSRKYYANKRAEKAKAAAAGEAK